MMPDSKDISITVTMQLDELMCVVNLMSLGAAVCIAYARDELPPTALLHSGGLAMDKIGGDRFHALNRRLGELGAAAIKEHHILGIRPGTLGDDRNIQ